MSILDDLEVAHHDLPGTELFMLIASQDETQVIARRVKRPKGVAPVGEVSVESQGVWMNVYAKREIKVGDRLRRITDSVAFEIVTVDTSWRGNRQTVMAKRVRGKVE